MRLTRAAEDVHRSFGRIQPGAEGVAELQEGAMASGSGPFDQGQQVMHVAVHVTDQQHVAAGRNGQRVGLRHLLQSRGRCGLTQLGCACPDEGSPRRHLLVEVDLAHRETSCCSAGSPMWMRSRSYRISTTPNRA